MQLTYEHILTLAPDPGTAQRAKSVAHAQRWLSLEGNGRAIWGKLGDPTDPYLTIVDFKGPAFRCSCPVRRLPCKHGIGLLLLFSKNNDAFRVVDEVPDWAASWLKSRDAKLGNAASPLPEAPARSSEAALALAAKRQETREKRMFQMAAGLAELENWIFDLFRQGLATLSGQADAYWNDLATRMVDAKLGTLARRIRQLPGLMALPDWPDKVLSELGDIYLLLKAFQRLDQLPEPLQDDLLGLIGVNQKKEEILASPGLSDRWLVVGQTESAEDNNLLTRRTWLVGEHSGRFALLLDFAWGGQGYDSHWRLGSVVRGELVFYASAFPLRALFKRIELSDPSFDLRSGDPSLAVFAKKLAMSLAANPWISHFPAFLQEVVPAFYRNDFVLVDREGKLLPLQVDEPLGWKIVAIGSGSPIGVFGTWSNGRFEPLGTWSEGHFLPLPA